MRVVESLKLYIDHFLGSESLHGIHSPFGYSFVRDVILNDCIKESHRAIEAKRRELLDTRESIFCTDLGTGKSGKYYLSDIVKRSAISPVYGRLLYRIAGFYKGETILELGTSAGIGTAYLAAGGHNKSIISIEGCDETAALAKRNLSDLQLSNVRVISGDIQAVLNEMQASMSSPLMVFFDANHTYKASMSYFDALLPFASDDSIFIFDDIRWSAGMHRAWLEISGHSHASSCIETYRQGIVFFSGDLSKQVYKIRF